MNFNFPPYDILSPCYTTLILSPQILTFHSFFGHQKSRDINPHMNISDMDRHVFLQKQGSFPLSAASRVPLCVCLFGFLFALAAVLFSGAHGGSQPLPTFTSCFSWFFPYFALLIDSGGASSQRSVVLHCWTTGLLRK